MKKLSILDCTLRDGGYYNNWDFDPKIVKRYLKSVSESSIDIVELGFRSLPQPTFMGPHRYTTDEYIETLDGVIFRSVIFLLIIPILEDLSLK